LLMQCLHNNCTIIVQNLDKHVEKEQEKSIPPKEIQSTLMNAMNEW
jgi:hypothetical protein